MELKPCPFCGGEVSIARRYNDDFLGNVYWPICDDCFNTCNEHFETEEEAIMWANRRQTPTPEALSIEQLMQMDGEPVWVVENQDYVGASSGWGLFYADKTAVMQNFTHHVVWISKYGENWTAFATKPAKEGEG